jgi:phage/plasmid-like protein (TIGR03299 family)
MFSVSADRRPPWHGLGAVLDERPASLPSALEAARLDWRVVQVPLYRLDGLDGLDGAAESEVQKLRGNVRADTGALLGVVSADYRVVQNMEAFAFLANLIGSELHFETAGSLWGGKAVWMLAELPDQVEVGGDAVRRFVLVTTRHDGTAAVQALVTPIRVVCANTLRVAIGGARTPTGCATSGTRPARCTRRARCWGWRSTTTASSPRSAIDWRASAWRSARSDECWASSTPTTRRSGTGPRSRAATRARR